MLGIISTAAVSALGAVFARPLASSVAVLFNDVIISVDVKRQLPRAENGKTMKPFFFRDSVYVPILAVGRMTVMAIERF